MLSKLRYFNAATMAELKAEKALIDLAPVQRLLGVGTEHITPVAGGTLAAAFMVSGSGRPRFLKTHAATQGGGNLEKEAALLRQVYGRRLNVETFDASTQSVNRLWLVMDWLTDVAGGVAANAAVNLIDGYARELSDLREHRLVEPADNFSLLLDEGDKAVAALAARQLLDPAVQESVQARLALLRRHLDLFTPQLCHGDLGPANIMSDGRHLIAIDWEDAFWGFYGYDYLYWLTFFSNRKYYSKQCLGVTQWGFTIEIAIMVLIVVLKSELSMRTGSRISNALSFNQRIIEIISIHG